MFVFWDEMMHENVLLVFFLSTGCFAFPTVNPRGRYFHSCLGRGAVLLFSVAVYPRVNEHIVERIKQFSFSFFFVCVYVV